jgi:hypothetical protein
MSGFWGVFVYSYDNRVTGEPRVQVDDSMRLNSLSTAAVGAGKRVFSVGGVGVRVVRTGINRSQP